MTPITFSDIEVRAALAGRKSVFREPVLKQTPKTRAPGEWLRVREAWADTTQLGEQRGDASFLYRATDPEYKSEFEGFRWFSAHVMPINACRLRLKVTASREERLHEITESEAAREGMDGDCPIGLITAYQKGPLVYHFAQVWEARYGSQGHAWATNPLVRVVEFRVT